MSALEWQMPGPAAFVTSVQRDLRDARNVILPLPAYCPDGLRDAIAARLREDGIAWRDLDLREDAATPGSPADQVQQRFLPFLPGTVICNARVLAESDELAGQVIWVDGITAATWPAWRGFLTQYEQACRMRAGAERAVFCVPLVGLAAEDIPQDEVAVAVRWWRGVSDRLDATLYLSHLLRARTLSRLERRLAVSMGVEIVGPDYTLGRQWATLDLREMFEPAPFLRACAENHGWTAQTTPGWQFGSLDEFDGARFMHSAAVACRGDTAEIGRRLWGGQLSVLFPFIEQERVRLIKEPEACWQVPFATKFGTVTDRMDLEIGHLLYQARRLPLSDETISLLTCLTRMRHALAHLEPVAYSDVCKCDCRARRDR